MLRVVSAAIIVIALSIPVVKKRIQLSSMRKKAERDA
jgi:putative ABC transport system permease protein